VTPERLLQLLALATVGGALSLLLAAFAIPRASEKLERVNITGRRVPAVLGVAVGFAGMLTLAVAGIAFNDVGSRSIGAALVTVALLFAAGAWDDLRGAEHARGFSGHLGAARDRRLTGGIVKSIGGLGAGITAGILLSSGWGIVRFALLVPLGANFINLTDRAPGRAGKVTLAIGIPLLALGHSEWAAVAVGVLGAVAAVLPLDLGARAMLGDAGANPLGGLLGLGLAMSLTPGWGWAAVGVLLALNLASEQWSYSEFVTRVRPLRWMDELGRK
jgi:UDP-GlcNAc:undecaprenyl-phosphate GlcNAc-1-phosphate transferase